MAIETRTIFDTLDQLEAAVGQLLGTSNKVEITQEMIDTYATLSGDDQWIHVDTERSATGPFGTTIAHGNLVLTMLPMLVQSTFTITSRQMGLNYGSDRVRFTAPVRVGSQLHAEVTLLEVKREGDRARIKFSVVVHADSASKPVCIAEPLVLVFE